MNKKAFTLAELLGVIVIISLLLLIIVPMIINGIQSREGTADEVQKNIIYTATLQFMEENTDDYPQIAGDKYCIPMKSIVDSGKLVEPVKQITGESNYNLNTTVIKVTIDSENIKTYQIIEDKEGC